MKKSKDRNEIKTLISTNFTVFISFFYAIYVVASVVFTIDRYNHVDIPYKGFLIALLAVFLAFVLVVMVVALRRFYMIVKLTDNGLKSAILGKLFTHEIKWEEIVELRYYKTLLPMIFISKDHHFRNKSIIKTMLNDRVIVLPLRKGVYEFIIAHTDKPIVDLTEEIIQEMYSKKK